MNPFTTAPRLTSSWTVDLAHSSVRFSIRHLGISTVHGRFDRWSGSLALDDAGMEHSRATARIEAASINTHEPTRDAHLRSAEFFDTDRYPAITFQSTRIENTLDGNFQMAGDLTIASVSRRVALDVEVLGQVKDASGTERAAFAASTTIDRRDFGLVWSQVLETGGLLVGEKVRIEISVEAVRNAGAAAFEEHA